MSDTYTDTSADTGADHTSMMVNPPKPEPPKPILSRRGTDGEDGVDGARQAAEEVIQRRRQAQPAEALIRQRRLPDDAPKASTTPRRRSISRAQSATRGPAPALEHHQRGGGRCGRPGAGRRSSDRDRDDGGRQTSRERSDAYEERGSRGSREPAPVGCARC